MKRSYKPRSIKDEADKALEKLQKANDPKTQVNPDGSVTVDLSDAPEEEANLGSYNMEKGHYENLVDLLNDDQMLNLATTVLKNVENDEASRSDWLKTIEFGFDLLGVKVEEKNVPFEGACSAQHPLLMESAVKFQSKASNELLPANGPVKTKVLGDITPEKEEQANRVKAFMNYQITEEMTEFYTDSERMLLYVPLVGSGFKKTYYNAHLERPCSEFVPADQFIVPNSASDLQRADRYTHILYKTEWELEADCSEGLYQKPAEGLGTPQSPKLTNVQRKTHELIGIEVGLGERDKVYTIYEQHIMLYINGIDKEEDGYKLASPYVITVDSASQKVIGVRRNWREIDKKRKKRVQFSHFQFVPSFNFYGFGYLHLLGNLQLTLTSALRSLVDAGQFANLQGGFKLKGVRIADDGSPVHPGQFKELETAVMDINKALMPLPFKEPSQVLYQMLEFIDAKGQKFADSTEQVIADSSNYGPVGTTMALLDASTKFFSAIHKRLHSALKNELKIIADINSETLPDNLDYNIENQTMFIKREDFGPKIDVVPVSDPNISSNAHRMAKAQTLLQMAMQNPAIHDMREVLKHVYTNMDYLNIDKILPKPEEAQPQDPMTDLQSAMGGKPVKAFPGQDHKAHIALKQAFIQDPMSGGNPMMQKISLQIQANIQEHMLLSFVEQTQAQMQQQAQGQQLPPEAQGQIMAQAASQVAQLNQQALQQQVEQAKQSPKEQATLLLAQAEIMDSQTQARKVDSETKLKSVDLALKHGKLQLDSVKEANRSKELAQKPKDKLNEIVTTKGIDAMIAGLSQGHDAKMQKIAQEHQMLIKKEEIKNKPKPVDKPKK